MPKVIFRTPAGRTEIVAEKGLTLMEAATDNDIAGIIAECGGACACATCHVYVDAAWLPRLAKMDDMEDAMLDAAIERRANSRLACQIELTDALDGIEVDVADNG